MDWVLNVSVAVIYSQASLDAFFVWITFLDWQLLYNMTLRNQRKKRRDELSVLVAVCLLIKTEATFLQQLLQGSSRLDFGQLPSVRRAQWWQWKLWKCRRGGKVSHCAHLGHAIYHDSPLLHDQSMRWVVHLVQIQIKSNQIKARLE